MANIETMKQTFLSTYQTFLDLFSILFKQELEQGIPNVLVKFQRVSYVRLEEFRSGNWTTFFSPFKPKKAEVFRSKRRFSSFVVNVDLQFTSVSKFMNVLCHILTAILVLDTVDFANSCRIVKPGDPTNYSMMLGYRCFFEFPPIFCHLGIKRSKMISINT